MRKTSQNKSRIAALPLSAAGGGAISVIYAVGEGAHDSVIGIFKPRSPLKREVERGRFYLGDIALEKTGDEILARFLDGNESPFGVETVEIDSHGGKAAAEIIIEIMKNRGIKTISHGAALLDACRRGTLHPVAAEAEWFLPSARTRTAAAMLLSQEKLLPPVLDAVIAGEKGGMAKLLERGKRASACVKPRRILIAGLPNAGKSSLMNALLGTDRVIVDETPGTTRDLVEETAIVDDVSVVLVDSAGLNPGACGAEKLGVNRAFSEIKEADLVLYLVNRSIAPVTQDESNINLLEETKTVVVLSKADLPARFGTENFGAGRVCPVSSKTGEGLEKLMDIMSGKLFGTIGNDEIINLPSPFSERQLDILCAARSGSKETLADLVSIEKIGDYYGW